MSTTFIYDGNEYQSRSSLNGLEGWMVASTVSGAILSPLAYLGKPFQRQLNKEYIHNNEYKDCFLKAIDKSGLKQKGLNLAEAQYEFQDTVYKQGKNACFIPNSRTVLINTDKISCAGFHELGHAMNALKSKYGVKYLAKMRGVGYAIAGLMEYFAIFSRTKPKGAPRNIQDVIEDNCGKIAFISMLPIVAEEAIASIRGIKLAKLSGLSKSLVKNLEKLYLKALLTYTGRAALGGAAVYASRKVMDYYTRPRLVEY